MVFHAYMLLCSDGSYYTGHTDNLEQRIGQHQQGAIAGYTKSRRPVRLVWSQEFGERYEALAAERRIKGWSKAKKEALIDGRWDEVSRLSRGRSQFVLRQAQDERGEVVGYLTKSVVRQMLAAAKSAAPREACGILLGAQSAGPIRIAAFVETANVHPTPDSHFEIDPQALIDAHRAARSGGPPVLGYFHSHPSGSAQPSATDAAMAPGDGLVWAIAAGGDVRLWRDTQSGFQPLSYIALDL